MEEITFTKMHGIGNDYIYIDCLGEVPTRLPDLAREMSDRHCGVGGDGIILILPSDKADFRMRIFNADGSEARMCGNGSRCVGKFLYDKGYAASTRITLETLAGIRTLELHIDGNEVSSVTVDMGAPETDPVLIPVVSSSPSMVEEPVMTSRGEIRITAISMGNPHGVAFFNDLSAVDFDSIGPELEKHPMWPDRANIEFAEIVGNDEIRMRVWERGSGETMACGTGACATAVAAAITGRTGRRVKVHLTGGDLDIDWDALTGRVRMTGPATTVFEGRYIRRS